MVVDAAAAKSDHNDDDADTPVVHRSPAHMPRSFSDVAGLHRRNSYAGSLEDVLDCPQHQRQQLRRTLAVADWLARVHVDDDDDGSSSVVEDDSLCDVAMKADDTGVSRWSSADHGFISGLMTESAELDASGLALTTATNRTSSIFPGDDDDEACLQRRLNLSLEPLRLLDEFQIVSGPCVRRRRMSIAGSADEARRRRPRRQFSLSVASSAVSSEYEYRESLVSKGFSVDLGEDLDGIMTPLSTKQGGGVTVAGMESLHQALKQIQRDVDEMNRKFDGLRSSTAVGREQSQAWSPADKSPVEGAMRFVCGEPSEQEAEEDLSSERQQSDYIWDYRSDLVQEGAGHQFVASRPIVPSSSGNFVLHRANLPRDYSDLCTEASTGCGTDDGMVDFFIDDDFGGTDDAVCEQVPEDFDTESKLPADVLPQHRSDATSLPGTTATNCHSTQVYNCSSDFSCCNCWRHPVSCGHSDSCCLTGRRHCCDVSSPQMRRSSVSNHPCCHQHPHHVDHPRPCSNSHSPCCYGHGDGHCLHCTRLLLRHSHVEEYDCCNNLPSDCHLIRSSTPADEIPPLDHCNNFHNHSSTGIITGRRLVGEQQDIVRVIDKTFSGCAALQQVCSDCSWSYVFVRELINPIQDFEIIFLQFSITYMLSFSIS